MGPATANTLRGLENGEYESWKVAPANIIGKKYKNIFAKIVDIDNIWLAYRKAAKGKKRSLGYLTFRQNEAANILKIQQLLITETYVPSEPRKFMVFEPKPREISALPFADRIIQHALCNIIEPIFEKVFLPQSHACRVNKGTHAAAKWVQSALRRMIKDGKDPVILKTDYSKYFANINHQILHREFRRKITCPPTIRLLDVMISPIGTGLPIGNLTSQLAANIYGHIIDRYLVQTLRIESFVRYMDDIVILHGDISELRVAKLQIESESMSSMRLRFSKWSIQSWSRGINFVGYRIWPTYKLLRKQTIISARRHLNKLQNRNDQVSLDRFISAWHGHSTWANSYNATKSIFDSEYRFQ